MLLENNNKIFLLSFQPSAAQDGKSRLGPVLRARAGRTQAATWAWAGKVPRALALAWAGELAKRNSTVRSDPTAERPFRAVKTTAAAGALENPSSFAPALPLSSLSLLSRSS